MSKKQPVLSEQAVSDVDAFIGTLGELKDSFEPGEVEGIILHTAAACHATNRAYSISIRDENVAGSWDEVSDALRSSAVIGVVNVLRGATPAENHEKWLETKKADGYKYGEVKDDKAKTHPCFVPYESLPIQQKLKDTIFQNVVSLCVGKTLGEVMARNRLAKHTAQSVAQATGGVTSDKN